MRTIAHTTAIILAGGQSSRMGEDKGLMLLKGKPMIAHIIETVSEIASEIIIIANHSDYEKFALPVYKDIVKGKGPLAGIVSGLDASKTDQNWILACDTPYVTADLLLDLKTELEGCDGVISSYQDRLHPLIAAYHKSALPILKSELEKDNLKLMRANAALNIKIFNANRYDPVNFKNLNSKQDL